ncbi:MAG: DUF2796 domain-containing protein [Thiothrix sp.]|nr:MAG: DUF2796 domain-containing protein [Thiothrix sp.]
MQFSKLLISSFSLLIALSLNSTYANDQQNHEEHAAHEHGAASLRLAIGTEGLEIMLESPAANLVGFEHTAQKDEDKKKLAEAKTKLETGAELFSINPEAVCTLKSAHIVSALLGNAETAKKEAEAHHENKSKKEHTEQEHPEDETHHDMDVTWTFTCVKPAELKTISTKLFATFPDGFQKIKAEWLTDQGASAQELTTDATLTLN